jgi:hypothetical protein
MGRSIGILDLVAVLIASKLLLFGIHGLLRYGMMDDDDDGMDEMRCIID